MAQLLSVSIPKDKTHVENVPELNKIICISLESLKVLYSVSVRNIKHEEAQLTFVKYINRIKDYFKTEGEVKFIKPDHSCFRHIVAIKVALMTDAGSKDKANKEKQEIHYIIFHDYMLAERSIAKKPPKVWQSIFCKLLAEINFQSYYNLLHYSEELISSSLFINLMKKIKKYPELFWVSPGRYEHVVFLVDLLMKYVTPACSITHKALSALIDLHQDELKKITDNENVICNYMRRIIQSNRISYERERNVNVQYATEIIPISLTGSMIDMKSCFPFSIEMVNARKKLGPNDLSQAS